MSEQVVAVLANSEEAARIAVAGNKDFVGDPHEVVVIAITPSTFARIDGLKFHKIIDAFTGEVTPIKRWIIEQAQKRIDEIDAPNLTIVEGALQ